MQKSGSLCESCKEHWEKQGLPPKKLGRTSGTTQYKKALVPACEYCDGDILVVTAMGHHDRNPWAE